MKKKFNNQFKNDKINIALIKSIEDSEETKQFFLDLFDSLKIKNNKLSPSEFIENYREMSAGNTFPGKFNFKKNPYFKEILNNFDRQNKTHKIILMKSVQIGATTCVLENVILYTAKVEKGIPMMVMMGSDVIAQGLDNKLDQAFKSVGLEYEAIAKKKDGKATGSTKRVKEFSTGASLHLVGSNSSNNIRNVSIKVLLLDEVDTYPTNLKNEGAVLKIAQGRTESYGEKAKIFITSTPTHQETSQIYKEYIKGDQRKFKVPCVKCGYMQVLEFDNLVYELDEEGNLDYNKGVYYQCVNPDCKHKMVEHDKYKMFEGGKWVPTSKSKTRNVKSYHLSGLYNAPSMKSWEGIVNDYLDAKASNNMQEFFNLQLGMPYFVGKEDLISIDEKELENKYLTYNRYTVPIKMMQEKGLGDLLYISSSFDVQKRGVWYETVAITTRLTRVIIDAGYIECKIEEDINGFTKTIINKVNETFRSDDKEDKKDYPILAVSIDIGYQTQAVKRVVLALNKIEYPNVIPVFKFGIKGKDGSGSSSALKQNKNYTYTVYSNIYKDDLSYYFKNKPIHSKDKEGNEIIKYPAKITLFYNDFNRKHAKQYTAERQVVKNNNLVWEQIRDDNHLWDCAYYNLVIFDILNLIISNGIIDKTTKRKVDRLGTNDFIRLIQKVYEKILDKVNKYEK